MIRDEKDLRIRLRGPPMASCGRQSLMRRMRIAQPGAAQGDAASA
jgi:hypothetical protein